MWGPLLGWCALELLAESIDAQNPERVALDLFDRLRLRETFAQAFGALGFEGEEGWRVAARIKVVLLTGAGAGKERDTGAGTKPAASAEAPVAVVHGDEQETAVEAEPAIPAEVADVEDAVEPLRTGDVGAEDERVTLSASLWLDPDVRWLTGVHESEGHSYVVREPYEELLWWLLMPSLLRIAGETAPSRLAVEEMSRTVEEALATAEAAGYRIDALSGQSVSPEDEPLEIDLTEPSIESMETLAEIRESQEPVTE